MNYSKTPCSRQTTGSFGTSGRTRTDTESPPVDFESTMSTIPSRWHMVLTHYTR